MDALTPAHAAMVIAQRVMELSAPFWLRRDTGGVYSPAEAQAMAAELMGVSEALRQIAVRLRESPVPVPREARPAPLCRLAPITGPWPANDGGRGA